MQLPTTYDDPQFGLMTFEDNQWTLERRAIFGDRAVPVVIEPDLSETRELSPSQRQAVSQALALPPDVLVKSASIVMQNYDVYREALGDDELPQLSVPGQVWDQVTFSYLLVPPHSGVARTPSFLLLAECAWDPEHGLEVRFRHGVAEAADQQGELGIFES